MLQLVVEGQSDKLSSLLIGPLKIITSTQTGNFRDSISKLVLEKYQQFLSKAVRLIPESSIPIILMDDSLMTQTNQTSDTLQFLLPILVLQILLKGSSSAVDLVLTEIQAVLYSTQSSTVSFRDCLELRTYVVLANCITIFSSSLIFLSDHSFLTMNTFRSQSNKMVIET